MKLVRAQELLRGIGGVIAVGAAETTAGARAAAVPVHRVAFVPPAGGDPTRLSALAELAAAPHAAAIAEANATAVARMASSEPRLIGIKPALDVIPTMTRDLVLHAGPPIGWAEMPEVLRTAVTTAAVLGGLARDRAEAGTLAGSGHLRLEAALAHDAVVAAAGAIVASTPVFVLEDSVASPPHRVFAPLRAADPQALLHGGAAASSLALERSLATDVAPALAKALAAHGPVRMKPLIAHALTMGDDVHHRLNALDALLFTTLAPALARTAGAGAAPILERLAIDLDVLGGVALPAARLMLAAAEGTPCSSVVTLVASNAATVGIQLAALPGVWFTGPALPCRRPPSPEAPDDQMTPHVGDAALLECVGLGAFAFAAAPAVAGAVGLRVTDAAAVTQAMARITVGRHPDWILPTSGAGTPLGIDLCRVLEHNVLPVIVAPVVLGGGGRGGAGLSQPPWECFYAALPAFLEHCRARLGVRPLGTG